MNLEKENMKILKKEEKSICNGIISVPQIIIWLAFLHRMNPIEII